VRALARRDGIGNGQHYGEGGLEPRWGATWLKPVRGEGLRKVLNEFPPTEGYRAPIRGKRDSTGLTVGRT
jgi:hypothetical protein